MQNPYAPPTSEVAKPIAPKHWRFGRVTWLYLILTIYLGGILFIERSVFVDGVTLVSVTIGFAMTALLAFHLLRALLTRNESPSSHYWTTAFVLVFIGFFIAVVISNASLIVACVIPIVSSTTLIGLMAWYVEKRYRVRIFFSMRRYHFLPE
jgi:hypothetical protein